jgi:LPS-assembly protein
VIRATKYNLIIAFIAGTIFLFLCPAIFAAENNKIDNPVIIEEDIVEAQGQAPVKAPKIASVLHDEKKTTLFESGRAVITDTMSQRLDALTGELKGKRNIRIEITGHTDNVRIGRPETIRRFGTNTRLSEARALSVSDYLKSKLNLEDRQITIVGKGESNPIADNTTDEGKAANRRVEILVWFDDEEKPQLKTEEVSQRGLASQNTDVPLIRPEAANKYGERRTSVNTFAAENKKNDNPVFIESEKMEYNNVSDVYNFQGNVVIKYEDGTLKADAVQFDNKNNIATAQGNAFLSMGADNMAGDKIVFNTESKTGAAYNSRAFLARNHFYIKGDKIEKTGENTYYIEKPSATTCDGDNPDWQVAGSEMKVTIDGYGLMKNARFLTKGLPVFYSPFIPFPAKTTRQSGFLLPYLSYSKNKDGVDVELPFFWAISPQMDATFYQRLMEKRGFKEGIEFRYYMGDKSFGTLYGDYLEDNKHVTETIDPATSRDWNSMHRRWSYYLNHQTNFDPQFYIRTDLRKVSDKWYFKDFSSHNYYLDHYARNEEDPFKKVPFRGDASLRSLESTARAVKSWSNYNITALISSTDDFAAANNDKTLQKYPELVFTGIKQPFLNTPVYFGFAGTYDYFYRNEGQKGHSIDISPTLSLPFNVSRYAKIIPQITFKEIFWSRDDNQTDSGDKSGNKTIYNASITASSQVSRIFDLNMFNWEKIRHEIKPEIKYSYIPNVNQDNIPDYVTALTPAIDIDPNAMLVTNVTGEQNAVAWSLTNTFIAKLRDEKGAYSYLEFLRLKLFQTYDINEAKNGIETATDERRPFSDIGIEFDLAPHKYLAFAARNKYSVYSGWKETNYDLHISDWRGDRLTVGYRYTQGTIEQINVSVKAIITKNIEGIFISSRDQFHSRNVENTVGVVYRSQCWAVGFDYTRTDTDDRFMLKLALSGLGGPNF